MAVEEAPAEGAGEAESTVVGGAAADANDAGSAPGPGDSVENFTQPESVELERVVLARGEHGEPDDPGGLDDGGVGGRLVPPRGLAGAMGGIDGGNRAAAGSKQSAHGVAEAVAAIAHRELGQGVLWAGA